MVHIGQNDCKSLENVRFGCKPFYFFVNVLFCKQNYESI